MYDIQLTKKAEKTYNKADLLLRNKFNRCFDNLKNDPYHHPNIKQLKGNLTGKWRYRVGDWRVIYSVGEERKLVIVLIIAPRGEAYER